MQARHRITIASDVDFDGLVAEIYYDERFVALLTQGSGAGLEVVFSNHDTRNGAGDLRIDLAEFLGIVEAARRKLTQDG